MEKEAAVQKVFDEVYVPVFLEKCARNGIKFDSKEDVETALTTAVMLKQAQATQAKEKATPSIVKQAALDLAELLKPKAEPEVSSELAEALNIL